LHTAAVEFLAPDPEEVVELAIDEMDPPPRPKLTLIQGGRDV
jgi:hypothetical protein